MKPKIGTHVSFTKAQTLVHLIEGLPDEIQTFQVYLGCSRGGPERVLDPEDIDAASEIIGTRGFYIHSCLTNYICSKKGFPAYTRKKIRNELRHVKKFPLSGVVIHPGTQSLEKGKRDLKDTLDIIVNGVYEIYKDGNEDLGMLLLENCAGEGSKVPRNLSELRYIIEELEKLKDSNGNPISDNIGVCIDTCHIFAAGDYDFSQGEEIIRFKKEFSKEIGLKYLKLIHLNDSKDVFGSRKDRHEVLGKGNIWKSSKLLAILFKLFPRVPFVCETKGEDKSPTTGFQESLPMIRRAEKYL